MDASPGRLVWSSLASFGSMTRIYLQSGKT